MIKSLPLTPRLDGAIESGPQSQKYKRKIETTKEYLISDFPHERGLHPKTSCLWCPLHRCKVG